MIERTIYTLAAVAAISLSGNVLLTAALVNERSAPTEATYSLVSQSTDGNVYVHDTGLTLRDCRTSDKGPAGAAVEWCEVEAPRDWTMGYDCTGATGPLYAREESALPECAHVVRGNARD